ncbi:hypothetical protein [Terasakiella sp. SH-1]|uniref:hypothetical protein n=1 Tax=Terasakiella sp. SH-1 TaxID=2560057 RepID=UPI0010731919|nr:hypothetical protein [Terasakiella sp. SH-1]
MAKENQSDKARTENLPDLSSGIKQLVSLKGTGLGAAHHAGMASAGGGFLTGKACGLKLGLGLSGFGGPVVLAVLAGFAGYKIFKAIQKD